MHPRPPDGRAQLEEDQRKQAGDRDQEAFGDDRPASPRTARSERKQTEEGRRDQRHDQEPAVPDQHASQHPLGEAAANAPRQQGNPPRNHKHRRDQQRHGHGKRDDADQAARSDARARFPRLAWSTSLVSSFIDYASPAALKTDSIENARPGSNRRPMNLRRRDLGLDPPTPRSSHARSTPECPRRRSSIP